MTKIARVDYAEKFLKQLKKAPLAIKRELRERIVLFLKDSRSPFLHNHLLSGKYGGYRSINITGDWRAVFSEVKKSDGAVIVVFKLLGTHSQLYK